MRSTILSSVSRASTSGSRPLLSSISRSHILATTSVHARNNSGVTKDWKGSSGEKSASHRVEHENDTTDPQTIASSRTMKDREENFGVGNRGESDAATERGGLKNQEKVKKDHPKAPTPVLGINDERAQKGV
ncbi:hypothetical protein BDW74DRAFT_160916 [Aspergillus multicolor]|uniref:uncharacterized protein n=1 Tax=Aspergillus multicolor TaxID=41759 RepID=UPI003CCCF9FE